MGQRLLFILSGFYIAVLRFRSRFSRAVAMRAQHVLKSFHNHIEMLNYFMEYSGEFLSALICNVITLYTYHLDKH